MFYTAKTPAGSKYSQKIRRRHQLAEHSQKALNSLQTIGTRKQLKEH